MSEELLETFDRYNGQLQVKIAEFKGKSRLDIRLMAEDSSTSELKPTKKGVSISVEEIESFKQAVDRAYEILKEKGEESDD